MKNNSTEPLQTESSYTDLKRLFQLYLMELLLIVSVLIALKVTNSHLSDFLGRGWGGYLALAGFVGFFLPMLMATGTVIFRYTPKGIHRTTEKFLFLSVNRHIQDRIPWSDVTAWEIESDLHNPFGDYSLFKIWTKQGKYVFYPQRCKTIQAKGLKVSDPLFFKDLADQVQRMMASEPVTLEQGTEAGSDAATSANVPEGSKAANNNHSGGVIPKREKIKRELFGLGALLLFTSLLSLSIIAIQRGDWSRTLVSIPLSLFILAGYIKRFLKKKD